jgi:hypothetical protein
MSKKQLWATVQKGGGDETDIRFVTWKEVKKLATAELTEYDHGQVVCEVFSWCTETDPDNNACTIISTRIEVDNVYDMLNALKSYKKFKYFFVQDPNGEWSTSFFKVPNNKKKKRY